MSIFQKMLIFQQIYVNISKKMSIFQQIYVNISKKYINISLNLCQIDAGTLHGGAVSCHVPAMGVGCYP